MEMQPDQASFLLSTMLPQIKNESKTTARVLAAVPADKGEYRPDERSMSAMQLAWHIASAEMFFMSGVTQGQFDSAAFTKPEHVQTPADVVGWYEEQFPRAFEQLCTVPGENLVKTIGFHGFENPGWGFLQLMIKHSVHHRGQLSVYLRPMGSKVPAIYGGSADEPVAAAATK